MSSKCAAQLVTEPPVKKIISILTYMYTEWHSIEHKSAQLFYTLDRCYGFNGPEVYAALKVIFASLTI